MYNEFNSLNQYNLYDNHFPSNLTKLSTHSFSISYRISYIIYIDTLYSLLINQMETLGVAKQNVCIQKSQKCTSVCRLQTGGWGCRYTEGGQTSFFSVLYILVYICPLSAWCEISQISLDNLDVNLSLRCSYVFYLCFCFQNREC